MKIVISKELLNKVVGNVVDIGSYNYPMLELNIQHYSFREWTKFNIHELVHKCKEWAILKGYIIKSELYDYNEDTTFSGGYFWITRINNIQHCPNCGASSSEAQAIIDACEWILKEDIKDDKRKC